ncbi:MAG: C10 family peptidase [Kiritimatiellae bacterium]|nr:C10 family peptidase [Kiritimatiellia bacterium]
MKSIFVAIAALALPVLADDLRVDVPADVRVASFLESKWGQTSADGRSEQKCFNYYVDFCSTNYSGCVATALGQVMRYYLWPKVSVKQGISFQCSVLANGVITGRPLKTIGGIYEWNLMPLDTSGAGLTGANCEAIGRLMYDIAVSSEAYFSPTGTYAGVTVARERMLDYFGYGSCECVVFNGGNFPYGTETLEDLIVPCVDYGAPVVLSISEKNCPANHEVVVDGYGYDSGGKFIIHALCGDWGDSDGWYDPEIGFFIDGRHFVEIHECLFNIFPKASGSIVSGRVTDSSGVPAGGAKVTLKRGGETVAVHRSTPVGVYAFRVKPGDVYSITAEKGSDSVSSGEFSLEQSSSSQLKGDGTYFSDGKHAPKIGNRRGLDLCFPKNYPDTVATPAVSMKSCAIGGYEEVEIGCATPGAEMHYTLDGSIPTKNSPLYSGKKIGISDTVTLKAVAWKNGMNVSQVAVEHYVYVNPDRPAGDFEEAPMMLFGEKGERTVRDYAQYGREESDPEIDNASYEFHSAWFAWTAPGSGRMTFSSSTPGESRHCYAEIGGKWAKGNWECNYYSLIGVYDSSGTCVAKDGAVEKVATETSAEFDAVAGETYMIMCVSPYHIVDDAESFVYSDNANGVPLREFDGSFARCRLKWSGNLTAPAPVEKEETFDVFDKEDGNSEKEQEDAPGFALVDSPSYGAVPEKGATYNGFAADPSGAVAGTFVLAVKKAKNGIASATITLTSAATGKKIKKTGTVDIASGECSGDLAGIRLGAGVVGGGNQSIGSVQGVADPVKAKDGAATGVLNSFGKKSYGLVLKNAAGISTLAATVAAKGKTKISGALADGTKLSASAQMCAGDRCCIPVVYSKKGVSVSFAVWFDKISKALVGVTGLPAGWEIVNCGLSGAIPPGSYDIQIAEAELKKAVPDAIDETPFTIAAQSKGKNLDAGKAAKVSYKKGELTVDTTKGGNISGIKLTVANGAVKGSLTVYSVTGGRLVKDKFTVSGVVIDGDAYCTASNKKKGSFSLNTVWKGY